MALLKLLLYLGAVFLIWHVIIGRTVQLTDWGRDQYRRLKREHAERDDSQQEP